MLTAALLWWSLFTALTALAATLPLASLVGVVGALVVVRFFLGVGESVALPNFNRAVADWIPRHVAGSASASPSAVSVLARP